MSFATISLSSVLSQYSTSDIVFSFVFAALCAVLGYRMSHRHRLARGVTPWRVPSVVWGVICFFLLPPFGLVIELLAQFTTKPSLPSGAAQRIPAPYPPFAGPPATDRQAIFPVVEVPVAPTGPPPPAGDGNGATPLFGWYADVTGRHEQRYWDGRRWSEFVRDGAAEAIDPI